MIKIVKSLKNFWQTDLEERKYSYLGEDLVTSYPIKENNNQLISVIDYFKSNNLELIYDPPSDLKNVVLEPKLRKSVAQILLRASKKLPNGLKFKLSEGHRPLWYQIKNFNRIHKQLKKKYPDKKEKKIWEETTKYIADPNLCPPHTTGGAIDITIVDKNNKELNMGTQLNSIDTVSSTFSIKISDQHKKNRELLYYTLTSCGFVNLPTEWWHYSYGDQYWAIFHKESHAIFGKIE